MGAESRKHWILPTNLNRKYQIFLVLARCENQNQNKVNCSALFRVKIRAVDKSFILRQANYDYLDIINKKF